MAFGALVERCCKGSDKSRHVQEADVYLPMCTVVFVNL